jgi:hypothetical protein
MCQIFRVLVCTLEAAYEHVDHVPRPEPPHQQLRLLHAVLLADSARARSSVVDTSKIRLMLLFGVEKQPHMLASESQALVYKNTYRSGDLVDNVIPV